jgi:hypothetical protein
MTGVQFDDMSIGVCGILYCPFCKEAVLPARHAKKPPTIEEEEVEGEDPGWT